MLRFVSSRAASLVPRHGRRSCASTPALEYASSCFLPTEWKSLPLLARRQVNHDSTIYEFGLPEGQSLNLPVCSCILMKAPGRGADGADAVRPYTPISDDSMLGKMELLVKRYEGGAASQWLHDLPVGSAVDFKHIKFNIKEQYPFDGKQSITLLCAGTGITPMYQALQKLMGTVGDTRPVTLLYGSKSADDILMKEELDAWAKAYPDRLKIVHVVGNNPDDPPPAGWVDTPTYTAETGWIDADKVARYAHPPSEDTLLLVCGLPPMYESLCGPRTEKEVADGTVLHTLGYSASMVSKM
mmetsp:Transcript_15450/g.39854  ORF Transcript_15450/g.39854 Transcript_15450/m.39854 type:complete len:299 (+) Transcript_15450:30-926(+)